VTELNHSLPAIDKSSHRRCSVVKNIDRSACDIFAQQQQYGTESKANSNTRNNGELYLPARQPLQAGIVFGGVCMSQCVRLSAQNL